MRILLITYHFPPDAEVGGVRPYQIARHLPEFGIEPWVLTVEPEFAESPNVGLLPTGISADRILRTPLEARIYDRITRLWRAAKTVRKSQGQRPNGGAATPRASSALRTRALDWLAFPDARFGWYQPALRAAHAAMRRVGFDAVVSSSPPRVASLIAGAFARRHRLPWVMDVRDPWWGWYETAISHDGPSAIMGLLQGRLFRRCVDGAAVVVHNTERLRQLTCRLVPSATPKTRCIPNGCDLEWRAERDAAASVPFRISYYGQIMGRRNPAAFLLGLRQWLDAARSDAPRVSVRFVGSGFEEAARLVQSLELDPFVEFTTSIPRQDVPSQMANDFVLLLVANAQPLQVPGKAYEYLGAGRRILALADHDGATADLIEREPACVIADRPEEVRAALERFYREHREGAEAWIDRTALLAELQYPRRVASFAKLLREIVPSAG